ncbi:MAG TPA: hypothetical protein VKX96_00290, partial [Chloroflexota bacterium]|nr:hypothetical protein [Chloroflexota bacterium]
MPMRTALGTLASPVALTILLHPECLEPHFQAEDSTFPDLILLDLPAAQALCCVKFLKESSTLHEVPVVALLGPDDVGAAHQLYDARVNCCVRRPDS